jgi:hypothetical protein
VQARESGLMLLRLAKATSVPTHTPMTTASAVILSVSHAPLTKTGQYDASGAKSREYFM